MSGSYSTIHQHEPLRAPAGWDQSEKRLIAQLEEIFDDLYSRFNRIKETDLGQDLRVKIENSSQGVVDIKVGLEGLSTTVSGIGGNVTTLTQTVSGLSTKVEDTASGLSSLADQTAEGFKTKVSSGDIASTLNQTPQSVLVDAGKINLSGYVTITGLSASGTTQIDGGRITTGKISAERIDVDKLYVKHLSGADGTFTGELSAAGGTFTGSLSAADGTFQGTLVAANGVFAGDLMCAADNGYTISIGLVDGYAEPSIYPSGYKVGNVGTRYHAFDYMFANHFTDPSSIRFKQDVLDVTDDDYDLMALRPITYRLKKDAKGKRCLGFIAEEVYESCPMLVDCDEKGLPSALEYSRFTVIAIREIQKLRRVVAGLEKRIKALEEKQ